jgi:CubicO group peptidase (beta-lactamase class C family)
MDARVRAACLAALVLTGPAVSGLSAIAAAGCQAPPPSPAAVPAAPSPAEIEGLLKARLGDHPGVGIVVGLLDAQGRRTIVVAGAASEGATRPLDGRTVFEIGSITKVFTSTLLAEMVGRGEVALDQAVGTLLPGTVQVPSRNGRQITLVTLATHRSGLPRMPDNLAPKDPDNPYAGYGVDQLYAFLSRCQLTRDVGEAYEYSNLGAGLLGHALALRLGRSYEDTLVDRVLTPLGMYDTRVTLSADQRVRLASGHTESGYPTANWDIPTLAGAGALRSTANDLLAFLAANLGGAPPSLRCALDLTHVPRADTGKLPGKIGLGWHIRTTPAGDLTWHNGGTGGYHSFAGFDARRHVAVVVLHNSAASIDDLGFHLLDPTVPLAAPRPLSKPRAEVALGAEALDELVGQYVLTPAFVLTITREGTQLFLQATGQAKLPLFAESDTRFFLKAVDAQVTFVKGAGGRAEALVLHQDGKDQRATRQQP